MSNGKIIFIRPPLDGELRVLSELSDKVNSVVLVLEKKDRIIWVHDVKGKFTVKKLTGLLSVGERDITKFAFEKNLKLKVPLGCETSCGC